MSKILHILVKPELVDEVIQTAEDNGSVGATIFKARSTSHHGQESFLNVELDEQVSLILMVVKEDKIEALTEALEQKFFQAHHSASLLICTPTYSVHGLEGR